VRLARLGLVLSLVAAAAACGRCAEKKPEAAAPAPVAPPAASVGPQEAWAPVPESVAVALKERAANPHRALELLESAWAGALDAGDARTAGMALHRSGDVSNDLFEFKAAEVFYKRALGLYELSGETKLIGIAANDLGLLSRVSGDDPVPWFRYAVEARRDAGEARGLRTSLGNLGARMLLRGQHEASMPILEESLALARAGGDLEGERKAHINLAGAWLLRANDLSAPAWLPDAGLGPRTTAFNHLRAAMELGARQGIDGYRAACEGLVVDARSMCSQLAGTAPGEAGDEEEDEDGGMREP
jgi:hypothetical protein